MLKPYFKMKSWIVVYILEIYLSIPYIDVMKKVFYSVISQCFVLDFAPVLYVSAKKDIWPKG